MTLLKTGIFLLLTTSVTAANAMCIRLQPGTPMFRTATISPQIFHRAVVDYVNRNGLTAQQGGGVHGGATCEVEVSPLKGDGSFDVTITSSWYGLPAKVATTINSKPSALVGCADAAPNNEFAPDHILSAQNSNLQLDTLFEKYNGKSNLRIVDETKREGAAFLGDYYMACGPKKKKPVIY